MRYLILLLFSLQFYAQSFDKITTLKEAEQYLENKPTLDFQIEHISTTPDSLVFYRNELLKKEKEGTVKYLESKTIVAFKVNYIYFDGKKLSGEEINAKRKEVLEKYSQRMTSDVLVAEYTMDHNIKSGGNLGWVDEINIEKTFREAVKNHKKGDVFTVDVPHLKWYYVVFKLYDDVDRVVLYYLKSNN
ncbi:peptidylprolyl isomerase [Flavobacterium sp. NRK F10]|uniref:peptidylprolyl isomerase n=1 Tax=Flavobacterium sp. NRK F10 TaxID=2954931 RepID=UPI0020900796|nr:peptidylprolyl isomerase [Flavobacterium sp. NRK F10]MCO6173647.1 peptidylprolyl isomerase [Flavobacterium sp. NRK F10]